MSMKSNPEKLAVVRKGKRKDPMQDTRSLMQFASESSRAAIRKTWKQVSLLYMNVMAIWLRSRQTMRSDSSKN